MTIQIILGWDANGSPIEEIVEAEPFNQIHHNED